MATKPFPIDEKQAINALPAAEVNAVSPRSVRDEATLTARLRHGTIATRNWLAASMLRSGLEHREFTVLSNDCWGQALYEGYGLPCQTPLAGAGMHADCFLRFLGDIEGHLKRPLRFIPETRYAAVRRLRGQRGAQNGNWPIALLGDDVEVHFLHYQAEDACRRAWDLGCERLNFKRLSVKFSADKDGATAEHMERFAAMPFERKLLISREALPQIACAVQTPNYVINGAVMFRRSAKYFDCTHWLNTGEILRNTPRVLACKALFARGV
jgi:uncharacterized protein (DUF1919 family)